MEDSKARERRTQKVKPLNLANVSMESPEPCEDVAPCDKLLESLRPLLSNGNNDVFPSYQLISGAASPYSTPKSAVVDRSPTSISADDLEILDSQAMLNSYEQDVLLSSLGTSSSNLSISCDELSPHTENTDKWNLPAESNYPAWKMSHEFSAGEHSDYVAQGTGIVREICQISKSDDRLERKWSQEAAKQSDRRLHTQHRHTTAMEWVSATSPRHGMSRVNSSNELFRQLDSSDNSDEMEDFEVGEKRGQAKAPMSKNLVSERRRRKKLNERLYSLRALVPKISKMDKASIVGDAISYVRDLQQQVEEMQADIANLEANKDAVAGCMMDPRRDPSRANINYFGKKLMQEHRIVELEVSQMEEQTYHLRIHCKKSPGVLVQLTRALEALEFDIVNANLTSVNDHILNTIVIELKNGARMKTDELREMTMDMMPRFGLFM